jgi:hypothetical protein
MAHSSLAAPRLNPANDAQVPFRRPPWVLTAASFDVASGRWRWPRRKRRRRSILCGKENGVKRRDNASERYLDNMLAVPLRGRGIRETTFVTNTYKSLRQPPTTWGLFLWRGNRLHLPTSTKRCYDILTTSHTPLPDIALSSMFNPSV